MEPRAAVSFFSAAMAPVCVAIGPLSFQAQAGSGGHTPLPPDCLGASAPGCQTLQPGFPRKEVHMRSAFLYPRTSAPLTAPLKRLGPGDPLPS